MTEEPVPANTLVQAEGGKFLVVDGVLVNNASGVITMDGQVFYFYAYGMVQNVSQLALYDNEWFVVREGMVP